MKKKLITLFFLIVITLSTKTFATDIASVTLNAPENVEKGQNVTVSINITAADVGVNGLQGRLNYDSSVLEYVDKTATKDNWFISGYNSSTGIFLLEVRDLTDTNSFVKNSSDDVASFTFKVLEDTTSSSTTVEVTNMVSAGSTNLQSQTTTTNITIKQSENGNSTDDNNNNDDNGNDNNDNDENVNDTGNSDNSNNDNSDTDNDSNSSNGSNSNGKSESGSSSKTTKTSSSSSKTTSKSSMPYTGLDNLIVITIVFITIVLVFSYIGFRRYRDI